MVTIFRSPLAFAMFLPNYKNRLIFAKVIAKVYWYVFMDHSVGLLYHAINGCGCCIAAAVAVVAVGLRGSW